MSMKALLSQCPVVPVMVIDDLEDAVPLAKALVAGGMTTLEITLRTDCALDAIERIVGEVEGAVVGSGTVRKPADLVASAKLGCQFAVSPGASRNLIEAAKSSACPLLPGAVTAREVMELHDEGYDCLKFFPAGSSGGAAALKDFVSPLAGISFCPTGGVNDRNLADYLTLPNVICVGGSWMMPKAKMAAKDWAGLTLTVQDIMAQAKTFR